MNRPSKTYTFEELERVAIRAADDLATYAELKMFEVESERFHPTRKAKTK